MINIAHPEFNPYSKEEEKKLFEEYYATLNPRIKEKILKSNYRFVMFIVRKYVKNLDDIDDYFSEGCIGLLNAFDKFDYTRDIRFMSYAVWWIKQTIFRHYSIEKRDCPDEIIKISLDSHNDNHEGNNEVIDVEQTTFENADELRTKQEIKNLLENHLAKLTKMERNVLKLHYVNEITYDDIADKYKVNRERIRSMVQRSIVKINKNPQAHLTLGAKFR